MGLLAAHLLDDAGFSVTGVDVREVRLPLPFPLLRLDLQETGSLGDLLGDCDAVLSWQPYHLNTDIATLSRKAGIHYFDQEDVPLEAFLATRTGSFYATRSRS